MPSSSSLLLLSSGRTALSLWPAPALLRKAWRTAAAAAHAATAASPSAGAPYSSPFVGRHAGLFFSTAAAAPSSSRLGSPSTAAAAVGHVGGWPLSSTPAAAAVAASPAASSATTFPFSSSSSCCCSSSFSFSCAAAASRQSVGPQQQQQSGIAWRFPSPAARSSASAASMTEVFSPLSSHESLLTLFSFERRRAPVSTLLTSSSCSSPGFSSSCSSSCSSSSSVLQADPWRRQQQQRFPSSGAALCSQRRFLGNEVTGPQFDLFDPRSIDLKTEAHYAGRMFGGMPALSYWDFQQTCASLRVFVFLALLLLGSVDMLLLRPINSAYWSLRWSPLRWPRALQQLLFPPKAGDVFTYAAAGEHAAADGSSVHTEACAAFLSLVYGCSFPPLTAPQSAAAATPVLQPAAAADKKQAAAAAAAPVAGKRSR